MFILIRYFEVKLHPDKKDSHFNYHDGDFDNYINYCVSLLKTRVSASTSTMDSAGFFDPSFILLKIDKHTIFNEINPILSTLKKEEEFFCLAKDYRSLIEKMVLDSPQTGVFYTSKVISELLVRFIKPRGKEKIYDPACGTAGFLLEADRYIQRNERSSQHQLIGYDISSFSYLISFVSFILSGSNRFYLRQTDSLNQRIFYQYYDVIISNPPFGKKEPTHNSDFVENDLLYTEYYFLKHIMQSLKDGGRAAVILPERFLFDKNKSSVKLKQELFFNFNVECVLSFPSGSMYPYTNIKIIMLCFSKSLPTRETWVYTLNTLDKLNRRNTITIEMFDDFFAKFDRRIISNNSWSIELEELIQDGYNVFQRDTNFDHSDRLDIPEKYLPKIHENKESLIISLDKITQKVEKMRSQINIPFTKGKFTSFKLGDLVHSLSVKQLPIDKLSNDGKYRVYGGNGIIGYYNEYIHSGRFIIIGRVGTLCGNVRYVEGKIWGTNNTIILECSDSDHVHLPYLAKVLEQKELRKLATGSGQPHLTLNTIKNIDIYLPPLKIQIELDQWLTELEDELEVQRELMQVIINDKNAMIDSLYQCLLNR